MSLFLIVFLTRTAASPAHRTARKSSWHNAALGRRAHVARSLLRHATGGVASAAHRERCGFRHGAFCLFGARPAKEESFVSEILTVIFGTAPVILALVWRNATDRRRDRAETVGAGVRSILARALGGESLIAVEVDPPTPWTHGRVHLSAPDGYWRLVDEACLDVAQRLPLAYDLVIHGC
jgi:hypothetical protein